MNNKSEFIDSLLYKVKTRVRAVEAIQAYIDNLFLMCLTEYILQISIVSIYLRAESSWILSTLYFFRIPLYVKHKLIVVSPFGHSFMFLFTALVFLNTTNIVDWTRDKRVKRQTKSKNNRRKNNRKKNKNSSTRQQTKSSRNKSQTTNNCLSTGMNWRQYQSYTVINR